MSEANQIKLFENKQIRAAWNDDAQKWYFSIVDTCEALSDTENPRRYWSDLKRKLKAEGATQLYENIVQLKLQSADGKNYKTDVADMEQLLRLIQSIPSPKAEPFKQWLAQVGSERLDETADPELAIDRALQTYLKMGYSQEWINQRLKTIEVRKELTDEWETRGVQRGQQFAILTDVVTKAWSDRTTREYKGLKGLTKENLRDNMTNAELVLNMLAELSTTEISKQHEPETFAENAEIARQGGEVAKVAREQLERRMGKPVVTEQNAQDIRALKKPKDK